MSNSEKDHSDSVEVKMKTDQEGLDAMKVLQKRLGVSNIATAIQCAVDWVNDVCKLQEEGYSELYLRNGNSEIRFRLPAEDDQTDKDQHIVKGNNPKPLDPKGLIYHSPQDSILHLS